MSGDEWESSHNKMPRTLSMYSFLGLVVVSSTFALLIVALLNHSFFEHWRRVVVLVGLGFAGVVGLNRDAKFSIRLGNSIWFFCCWIACFTILGSLAYLFWEGLFPSSAVEDDLGMDQAIGAGIMFMFLLLPGAPLVWIFGSEMLSLWSFSAYDRIDRIES